MSLLESPLCFALLHSDRGACYQDGLTEPIIPRYRPQIKVGNGEFKGPKQRWPFNAY